MERKIKLRLWDTTAKKMRDNEHLKNYTLDTLTDGVDILMQYTELKDKNGKEIYENDIISMYIFDTSQFPKKIITTVSFYEGMFITTLLNNDPLPLRDAIIIGLEVIGNIYENNNLIK